MKKIFATLENIIGNIYLLIMLVIFILLIFVDKSVEYACKNSALPPNFILLLMGILFFSLLIVIYKKLKHVNIIRLLIIISIFIYFIQIFLIYNLYFTTGWDVQVLRNVAESLAATPKINSDVEYFKIYPNNALLLFILTMCTKISNFFSLPSGSCALLLGAFLVTCSVLLVGLVIYKVTKNRTITILGYTIAAVLFGISPWLCITYSDVFSILFPILTIYIYICIRDAKLHCMLKTIVIMGIPCIGYLIKPQSIIILVAIVICEVLCLGKEKIVMKKILLIFLSCIIVAVGTYTISAQSQKYTGVIKDDDIELGLTHFAMMGIHPAGHGVYVGEDVGYSLSFMGKKNKQKENLKIIKKRLLDMGVIGFAEHIAKKTLINYNDGTFAWGAEGAFYLEVKPEPMGKVSSILRNVYYNSGKYFSYFASFEQMIWVTVLFLSIFTVLLRSGKIERRIENIVILSIIGITLFTAIFEARARYLFLYAPVFVLCSMMGVYKISEKFIARHNRIRREEKCEDNESC